MATEKKISSNSFDGGRNTDTAPQLSPQNIFTKMLNMRVYGLGQKGVAASFMGNTEVANLLPLGDNQCIGHTEDEENNVFYYFVYNSNKFHTIYRYSSQTKEVTVVIQNLTDTNGADILKFDPDYLVLHANIISGLMYYCDGLNKARKFNIAKAIDKSDAGYGTIIFEDFITSYKQTSIYAPVPSYITDPSRNSNNVYGSQYKFAQRYHYDDFEVSNWSDWSVVPQPAVVPFAGLSAITNDNNCIQLKVETGNKLVTKIELAVLSSNPSSSTGGIDTFDWVISTILDKDEQQIADNSTFVYNFYNDGSYTDTDQDKVNRNYSYMQRIPVCQALTGNAMTYTGGKEGFPKVAVKASIAVTFDQLYIPDSTQNQLNSPSLVINTVSIDKEHPFLSKSRYNPTYQFIIGHDVKKGNKFEVFGRNGKSDNYYNSFTASGTDTANTIASAIKAWLRSIGRGYPSAAAQISAENVNSDGDVSFNWGYLGQYGEGVTVFTGTVNPVSYQSLKDSGSSLPIIPYGCVTNYGFVYVDDDGRESLAYTNASCVIRTPYITEIGDYKLPVHTITVNHVPPSFAKYWKLVRSKQPHGLEILVQQVVNVPTANTSEYLDLVVGSLLTYQKLHPNTILNYQFKPGDRIRLIKNVDTGAFYTYYETEVLSYSEEVSEDINANITVDGTTAVQPDAPIDASFIGRVISIEGVERTIIGVDTGANKYNLDQSIIITPVTDTPKSTTYSGYKIIDRRGSVRIRKPSGITIANNSLVEIYTPQLKEVSSDYKLFYDFGQKFEVANWGTANACHRGSSQDQTASQPAIVVINKGDAYIRDRELPANNVVPGTQVLVSKVVDPNASDFYKSDLHDTGRVYPQDDGKGERDFGSRTRYSGNFIQDTSINGLNDFDNLDRVDNNDAYGDIRLTKFFNNRLYVFKTLKAAFIPINHTLTSDGDNNVLNVQSSKLLNQIQYYAWEGGIGNNPESWFYYGNFQYFASTNSACFARLGGEGVEPISTLYGFDKRAREILLAVDKYKLNLHGQYDIKNNEAIWVYPPHIQYAFNGAFDLNSWQTSADLLPNNVTYQVTQQPASGQVIYDPSTGNFEVSGTQVGNDFYLYRPIYPDGTQGEIRKQCLTTVQTANRQTAFVPDANSAYCVARNTQFVKDNTSAYCVQQQQVVLQPFDFLVIRDIWTAQGGQDLDTAIGLDGTGTPYDIDRTNNANWVGYNQTQANHTTVAITGTPLYIKWGGDNTQNGVEAALIDFKQFSADYSSLTSIMALVYGIWYASKASGAMQIQLQTYLGGTMSQSGFDFINTGGTTVDLITIDKVVTATGTTANINADQLIGTITYDTTTKKATLS